MKTDEKLFRLFADAGEELYLVGGRVRDHILGLETGDLDFATGAMPESTMEILRDAGVKPVPVGIRFGTVAAEFTEIGGKVPVQITTFRCRETYTEGSRHPSVEFGGSLEEDLSRRDFTVNAIAMDSHGKIIDPLDGTGDIRRRVIRTPLDPTVTIREDPLRMLRAFRFACRLGFTLDPDLEMAIRRMHRDILVISRERWKSEMDQMLSTAEPLSVVDALRGLRSSGMLEDMIPELAGCFALDGMPQGPAHVDDVWGHTLSVVSRIRSSDPLLRWAALLHDAGKPAARTVGVDGVPHFHGHETEGGDLAGRICERFRFSRKERASVVFLVRNHMRPVLYSGEWSDRAVRRLIEDAGGDLDRLMELATADVAAHSERFSVTGEARLAELNSRIGKLGKDMKARLLPRELGLRLRSECGPEGGHEVGVLIANLEELVRCGVLPAMAQPETYLSYLQTHPELKEPME